ncbi:MAG: nitronate monooxygenase [Proteobacteria bacterium]|nr:nitronate monooxygenase [Pseudomonadota bacterium]
MADVLHTALCDMLACRYPVIQTAMGWVARPELVAATCNAGAFGFLACAVMSAEEVGPAIDRVRQLTDAPFGVNFASYQPGAQRIVEIIIEKRVRAVSFGRGPDRRMIEQFRQAGIFCIPTVGAVRHAQKMADLGVDAIVVQGGEGGGHTGSVPSTILLPQVLDAVSLPVVAAGGFADGRGLAAALAYGAQGIAMGTRFLMTRDCPVPEVTKQRYVAATTGDILVTERIDGIPQRMIRNEVLERIESARGLSKWLQALGGARELKRANGASWLQMLAMARQNQHAAGLSFTQTLYAAIAPALFRRSMEQGQPQHGLLATGLVAGRLDDLPSCAELIEGIIRDARERLVTLGGAAA